MRGTRLRPFGADGIITYNRVRFLIDGKREKKLFAKMGESIEVNITVKPLSAAAERSFSLLNNSFKLHSNLP